LRGDLDTDELARPVQSRHEVPRGTRREPSAAPSKDLPDASQRRR
jgi:hypothetical protein